MEEENSKKGFDGLRVLTLESRRAPEMAKLIASNGGTAMVAPSMREIPLESNTAALAFGRKLLEGGFDAVIFLTGVGTRALSRAWWRPIYPHEQFVAALRKIAVIARGPKPVAVLREWEVPIALTAPEPNTWREVLRALDEGAGDGAARRAPGGRAGIWRFQSGLARGPGETRRASYFCSRLRMGFARGCRAAAGRGRGDRA